MTPWRSGDDRPEGGGWMAAGTDRRRSIADRNVTAILDAAEQLIAARAPVTIAGVASAAGVSRVTVYAHFPTSEAVLEAVVERAVGHAAEALAAARPGEGPPAEALMRLLATGWQELGRHADMAEAASAMLPAAAMTRSHAVAHSTVAELLHRGQEDGTFRADLPMSWLVTCCFALIHGCRGEVTAGRLAEEDAERVLASTIRDLILRRKDET
jgi:TetR/AcrR family transcriptional repressor of mexCD-oprJ operon